MLLCKELDKRKISDSKFNFFQEKRNFIVFEQKICSIRLKNNAAVSVTFISCNDFSNGFWKNRRKNVSTFYFLLCSVEDEIFINENNNNNNIL